MIKNYHNDKVTIDGIGITWPNKWGGLIDMDKVSHITISGIKVINAKNAGVFLDTCHHIHISHMKTHNTFSSGLGVWDSNNITLAHNEVSLACNDGGEECISISNSHHVNVHHNEVHHSGPGTQGGEGIDVKDGSHDVRVANNHIHHLQLRTGLYADAWYNHTYNIVFDSNRVHDCSNVGMAVASERGGLIEKVTFVNNIVYNNIDGAMAIGGWTGGNTPVAANPVKHIKIINNTFYHNYNDGIYVINKDAKDIKIYNNIIGKNISSTNTAHQIYIEYTPLSEVDIRSNLIEGLSGGYAQQGKIIGNPLFVDAQNADFRLQQGSPAINKGIAQDVSLVDYVGNTRALNGSWDIGAYAYKQDISFLIPLLYLML